MIRDAQVDDAAAIAAIWNPIIRDTDITFDPVEKTEAEIGGLIAARRDAGWAFLLAEAGGEVLGFASYFQFRGGQGYVRTMEHSINLAGEARGRGRGRALMTALAIHARSRGIHMLIGAIAASNNGGLDFHRRIGFSEVGRIPEAGWKFGRYHDLVFMQRILDPPHGQGAPAALD